MYRRRRLGIDRLVIYAAGLAGTKLCDGRDVRDPYHFPLLTS